MNEDKKNILLIDDDYKIWKSLFDKFFPKKDYGISYFKDVEEVKNLYKYDCLIVDYFLENEKTGKEWVEKNVRNKDPFIPVIFWTSSYNPEIIKNTLLGDKVFFKKFLDLENFKEEVDKSIDKYRRYKDFPLYNNFFNTKITDPQKRELAHKVYINTSKYLESFFAHSKYHSVFNSHGLIHTQNVLNNLSKLMYPIANEFTEEQYLVAYISTILHDFGMMPTHYNDDMENKEFKTLRSNHAKTIFWWIATKQIDEPLGFELNDDIRYYIAMITLYHDAHYDFNDFFEIRSEYNDDDKKNNSKYAIAEVKKSIDNNEINDIDSNNYTLTSIINFLTSGKFEAKENYKIIAGLVALADKLDFGESRVPIPVLRESPYRSLYDEFEYIKNECFESFEFKNKKNGNGIFIEIKNSYPKDINEENIGETFTDFKNEISENDGDINSKVIAICSKALKTTIKEKYQNIKNAFEKTGNSYLGNFYDKKFIEFKESDRELNENNIFRNIYSKNDFSKISDKDGKKLDVFEKKLLESLFDKKYFLNKKNITLVKTGFSNEKVLHIKGMKQRIKNNQHKYENNSCIVKLGRFDKIHREVLNYKKYAVPFIEPRSLIGYMEDYRYLDLGAYISYITPSEAIELDKKIDYNEINSILEAIKKSLSIFYKKIKPFSDRELYTKVIDNFEYEKDKLEDLIKHEKTKDYEKKIYRSVCEVVKEIMEFIKNKKPELTSSISHADFTFRNILVIDNNYIFIDFANTGINHFFLDLAKLEHFIIIERFIKKSSEDKKKILDCYTNIKCEYENAKKVKKEIEKNLKMKLSKTEIDTENEFNFEFEMNLARLFVNLNSVRFEKDFPLKLSERMELVNYFYDKVKKEQKNVN